jgi:hypothetical protein
MPADLSRQLMLSISKLSKFAERQHVDEIMPDVDEAIGGAPHPGCTTQLNLSL